MPYKNPEDEAAYQKKYHKEWYSNEENRAKRRKQILERRQELRKRYTEYKSNLCCSQCGFSHPAALDFHHLDPNEKEDNIPVMISRGVSWSTLMKEIEKCVPLCSNCHRILHYNEGKE